MLANLQDRWIKCWPKLLIYDEEVDAAVDGLTALLEPMLMVFLGCVVGFIVVAMYLPIFKMGDTI